MRISTLATHLQQNSGIRSIQRQLLDSQRELSTGRKSDLYQALGGGVTLDFELRSALAEITVYRTTTEIVGLRLESMQHALTAMKGIATEARDATMSATGTVSRDLLAEMARNAIDQVGALLNTQIGGRALFSGINTDMRAMQPAGTVNGATGYSPVQAVGQVIAGLGPITDAASAMAAANGPDGVASLFSDTHSDSNLRYSTTFYLGATSGSVDARIDEGLDIDYGIRADDPAIKMVLEGLHMLAAVPYGSVPDDAFVAWQNESLERLNNGLQGVVDLAANLGFKQSAVSEANLRHESELAQVNNEIARLERADPFEVASRLSELQTQLEATLTITARVSRLTLTNYL